MQMTCRAVAGLLAGVSIFLVSCGDAPRSEKSVGKKAALPSSLQTESKSDMNKGQIISVFRQYETRNDAFLSGVGSERQTALRQQAEVYAEGQFMSAMDAALEAVCGSGDLDVLRAFFRVIWATQNSAMEQPAWVLGKMFECRTDLLMSELRNMPHEYRDTVYGALEFGLENILYGRPPDDPKAKFLRRELESLEAEAMHAP